MNRFVLASLGILVSAGSLLAADAAAAQFLGNTVLAAAIGVGIAAGGCGVGMGFTIAAELQGIARQPELAQKLMVNMMIGIAFIESLTLYALFIGIILLFANPFSKVFVGG